MTKPRLTKEEHVEIGRQLAIMQSQLAHLHTKLANAYPLQGKEATPMRKVGAVEKALEAARYALENALFDDHPEADTSVYFPKT
ncbi:hypothetical protein [Streptomyces puniciscabiei]|uniref:hypothetical protein n=1 Tax=Streptomyces puniciscabiei TaxID=164348 RepID=UPI0033338550